MDGSEGSDNQLSWPQTRAVCNRRARVGRCADLVPAGEHSKSINNVSAVTIDYFRPTLMIA